MIIHTSTSHIVTTFLPSLHYRRFTPIIFSEDTHVYLLALSFFMIIPTSTFLRSHFSDHPYIDFLSSFFVIIPTSTFTSIIFFEDVYTNFFVLSFFLIIPTSTSHLVTTFPPSLHYRRFTPIIFSEDTHVYFFARSLFLIIIDR